MRIKGLRWTFAPVLICGICAAFPGPIVAQIPLPDSAEFVASSEGRVYYPRACAAWKSLSAKNLIYFPTSEAAEARGYERTRNRQCEPPASLGSLSRTGTLARPSEVQSGLPPPLPDDIAGVCIIARVIDGDTLQCRGGLRIRLLLIDSPESGQADLGVRARLALEELLPAGDSALVRLDLQERDRYGRVLAHLHRFDGTWINRLLVREGYAVPLVYPPNVTGVEMIRAAADSARQEQRGLWARGAFDCPPVDYRAGRCGG